MEKENNQNLKQTELEQTPKLSFWQSPKFPLYFILGAGFLFAVLALLISFPKKAVPELPPQKEKVVVATDKKKYGLEDVVSVTARNNTDVSLFFIYTAWELYRYEDKKWLQVSYPWPIPAVEPLYSLKSLKPGDKTIATVQTSFLFQVLKGKNPAGIYKLEFSYTYLSKGEGEWIKAYSNEFEVKAPSVTPKDSRCLMPKPKEIGGCEILRGYYYDAVANECKPVSGCEVKGEIPFDASQQKECARLCVKDEKSCVNDKDCVLVNENCCGCQAGGSKTCINRNFYNQWQEKLDCKKAGGIVCPQVYLCGSNPTSCQCVNDVCQGTRGNRKKIDQVKLKASAPFSTAIITIDSNGDLEYEAESRGGPIEPGEFSQSKKISQSQFDELVDLIYANNFFSFNDEYREEYLMDAVAYKITVYNDNQVKSVSCYGTCPEEIVEIRTKIKDLFGKDILEIGV